MNTTTIGILALLAVVGYIWGKVPVSELLRHIFHTRPERKRAERFRLERLAREADWNATHCPVCQGRDFQKCKLCGNHQYGCQCSYKRENLYTVVGCEACNWTGLPQCSPSRRGTFYVRWQGAAEDGSFDIVQDQPPGSFPEWMRLEVELDSAGNPRIVAAEGKEGMIRNGWAEVPYQATPGRCEQKAMPIGQWLGGTPADGKGWQSWLAATNTLIQYTRRFAVEEVACKS